MRTFAWWFVRALSLVMFIIGLGGIGDDLQQWTTWLQALDQDYVRTGLVIIALLAVLTDYILHREELRDWIRARWRGRKDESASQGEEQPQTAQFVLDTRDVDSSPPTKKSPGEEVIDYLRSIILMKEEWAPPEGTLENQLKLEFLNKFSVLTADAMVRRYEFDGAVRRLSDRMASEVRVKMEAAREDETTVELKVELTDDSFGGLERTADKDLTRLKLHLDQVKIINHTSEAVKLEDVWIEIKGLKGVRSREKNIEGDRRIKERDSQTYVIGITHFFEGQRDKPAEEIVLCADIIGVGVLRQTLPDELFSVGRS